MHSKEWNECKNTAKPYNNCMFVQQFWVQNPSISIQKYNIPSKDSKLLDEFSWNDVFNTI